VRMAWIELHQSVWTHRKTLLLADALDLNETHAAAHILRLWTWALDNAPHGRLTGMTARVLARGADWAGDPGSFLEALVEAGWIDREGSELCLHDWDAYVGKLTQRREANAERMRQARTAPKAEAADAGARAEDEEALPAEMAEPRAPHVRSTGSARAGAAPRDRDARVELPDLTVPDLTVPDPTGPDLTGPYRTGPGTAAGPPAARERRFEDASSASGALLDVEARGPDGTGEPARDTAAALRAAFARRGVPLPRLKGREAIAARELARQHDAEVIAAFWQAVRGGMYGDRFLRSHLTMAHVGANTYIADWLAQGEAAEAARLVAEAEATARREEAASGRARWEGAHPPPARRPDPASMTEEEIRGELLQTPLAERSTVEGADRTEALRAELRRR